MIGQQGLLSCLIEMIQSDKLPKVLTLIGGIGSGRRTVAFEISKALNATFVVSGKSIDEVRKTIHGALLSGDCIVCVFPDVDSMSVNAQNALLKFIEDVPKMVNVIITATSVETTLQTVLNRSAVFFMEHYSSSEMSEYLKRYSADTDNSEMLLSVCRNIGELETYKDFDIKSAYDLANNIVENIGSANIGNALKISSMLSAKNGDSKIDPIILMRLIVNICQSKIKTCEYKESRILLNVMNITSKYIRDIAAVGRNRAMLIDNWVVDMKLCMSGDK